MMQFNSLIRSYKVQLVIAFITGIGLIHLTTFLYRSVPSQMGIDFGWNELNVLYVTYVHPDRTNMLRVGDVIQELNGVVPIRGMFNLPTPLPKSYDLVILRDNSTFKLSYVPIEPYHRLFLDIYISLTIWALGVAILFVTKSAQWGIVIGGGYIAWALAWLGILTTDSATSWYANALVFPLVAPLLASSAFYFYRPLSNRQRQVLKILFGISILVGLANVWGVIIKSCGLVPNQ